MNAATADLQIADLFEDVQDLGDREKRRRIADLFKADPATYTATITELKNRAIDHELGMATPIDVTRMDEAIQRAPRFGFRAAAELVAVPTPPVWLIRNMIETDTVNQLFGETGSGKSFLAIDWGLCIATGTPWHGLETRRGVVFYIAGEGHRGIGRRIKVWELERGVSVQGAPFFVSTSAAALADRSNAAAVGEAIGELAREHGQPELIVVDTLARNLGPGDENSAADIGNLVANLDAIRAAHKCSVLIVHHPGYKNTDRGRGSSALPGAVDTNFGLQKTIGTQRTLTCSKVKEGETNKPVGLELRQVFLPKDWADEYGNMTTSCIFDQAEAIETQRKSKLSGSQQVALAALEYLLTHDSEPPTEAIQREKGDRTPRRVVKTDTWRERCYSAGISPAAGSADAKSKAFRRAVKELLTAKRIETWDDLYWIPTD